MSEYNTYSHCGHDMNLEDCYVQATEEEIWCAVMIATPFVNAIKQFSNLEAALRNGNDHESRLAREICHIAEDFDVEAYALFEACKRTHDPKAVEAATPKDVERKRTFLDPGENCLNLGRGTCMNLFLGRTAEDEEGDDW